MSRILVLDNVSELGLRLFGNRYSFGTDRKEPEAIIVRSTKVDTDQYPDLLAVARAGAGVNTITVDKATKRGIPVFNTPGANANAVAELVFFTLGAAARKIPEALDFMRSLNVEYLGGPSISERVEKEKSRFAGFELAGKTLGVIGLGKIGVMVANAGIRAGMRVVGFDAFLTIGNVHQLDAHVEIQKKVGDVLSRADILSVHVPYSDETHGLIGEAEIAQLRKGAILINFARGGIYDDAAVLVGIASGKIGRYITDFPDERLVGVEKVICTPHLGASTAESEENCAVMACKQLKDYLEQGTIRNAVNFPVIELVARSSAKIRLAIANEDVPNMLAKITGVLGTSSLNIQALANEGNKKIGYSLIDLDSPVSSDVVQTISDMEGVLSVRRIVL